jgi:hypothetical protein
VRDLVDKVCPYFVQTLFISWLKYSHSESTWELECR